MQFNIEKIILILSDNQKREIEFHDGVNIISGKSQTGKSALIDIIDYCLFSRTSTIPHGVIYKSVDIYCLVLWINNRRLILARNRFLATENAGKSRIFLYEINEKFNINNINMNFFKLNINKYLSEAQFKDYSIKNILDIPIEAIPISSLKETVLSFRSMTSFMFQHQNLMASKFALFYRLDTFIKIKQTQRDFRVFMNIDNIQSIGIESKLEAIKKRLNLIEKEDKFFKDKFRNLIDELRMNCIEFYAVLGESEHKILQITGFDEESILKHNDIIEDIKKYSLDNGIPEELYKIKKKRDDIYLEINKLNMTLEDINNYSRELESTTKILDINIDIDENYGCPLCGEQHESDISQYNKAKLKIKSEINEISSMSPKIIEQKSNIEERLKNHKKEYQNFNNQYVDMKKRYKNIVSEESKKEELLRLKTKIIATQDMLKEFKSFNNQEKETLLSDRKLLEIEKSSFDFHTSLKKVEVKISEYITEYIKNGLELEEGLGEASLYFNLEEFTLKQKNVFLSEMGSGSNWLNCHIALLFGLHKYIALNNSKIPSFIFFDQPSQVYFPSEADLKENNKESDLKVVENIFKKIIENVETINMDKNCKSKVQLFITDHYYNEEEWFTKYVIKDGQWKDGKKLIPQRYE